MRIYYSQQPLIYKGFYRYWRDNDSYHKYFLYKKIKKFKHENPIEFKNKSKYNILENKKPLYCYGKQFISIPRKFIVTLKLLNSRAYKTIYKNEDHHIIVIGCVYMRKKLCSDYYLPIYDLGE